MMTKHWTIASFALVALTFSAPSAAQDGADDIVVQATMSKEDIAKASHDMARSLTAITVGGQVPRWTRPICARVEGVAEQQAEIVSATLKKVAGEAGARLAGRKCDANVFVIFTSDGAGLAQRLADRLPMPRQRDGRVERDAFTDATGPLRWETRVSLHDARHGPLVANSAALLNSGDYALDLDVPSVDSADPSLIRRKTKASIDGMMVLVDAKAATGMTMGQLAEYVAMVVLARPPMSVTFEAHPSILNLAAYSPPGPSPLHLSEWDRAYLTALYSAPADRSASAARSLMAKRMTAALTEE